MRNASTKTRHVVIWLELLNQWTDQRGKQKIGVEMKKIRRAFGPCGVFRSSHVIVPMSIAMAYVVCISNILAAI